VSHILTSNSIYVLASLLSNTTWIWNSLRLIWYVLLPFPHSPTNSIKTYIIVIFTYKYASVTNLFSSSSSLIFYKTVMKIVIKDGCKYVRKNQLYSIRTQVTIIQTDGSLDKWIQTENIYSLNLIKISALNNDPLLDLTVTKCKVIYGDLSTTNHRRAFIIL
jgi:hypothetical protein